MAWFHKGRYPTHVSPWALLWAIILLLIAALLDTYLHTVSIFLVPPFAAMLSILLYLPQQPVAQPLPVIVGSTVSAAIGTGVATFVHGPMAAAIVAAVLLFVLPWVGFYHPPAIALAMYPLLLKPGPWFPLVVVLPFTLVAVVSHRLLSRTVAGWPRYPRAADQDDPVTHLAHGGDHS